MHSMKKIMVVEDQALIALKIKTDLLNMGHFITGVYASGEEALENITSTQPDIVLMDIQLQGEMDGIQTADKLLEIYDIPVIFLTAHSDEDTLNRATTANPYGYLLKPVTYQELQITIQVALYKHKIDKEKEHLTQELKKALDKVEVLSRTDFLTSALNRRAFDEILQAEFSKIRRYNRPFSVAYIDLDNFKNINDTMGHSAGDNVLKKLVDIIRNSLRDFDSIARLGGDEIAILLSETDLEGAVITMERIKTAVLQEMHQKGWPVTLSIGVITCHDVPQSADELLAQADGLMYEVKKNGKNAIRHALFKPKINL